MLIKDPHSNHRQFFLNFFPPEILSSRSLLKYHQHCIPMSASSFDPPLVFCFQLITTPKLGTGRSPTSLLRGGCPGLAGGVTSQPSQGSAGVQPGSCLGALLSRVSLALHSGTSPSHCSQNWADHVDFLFQVSHLSACDCSQNI